MDKKQNLTEDEAMNYFTMILIGLHYLHSKNIVHRDLKPANILIDKLTEGVDILKIGDFGIAKVDIQEIKKKFSATLGEKTTPAYAAPETMKEKPESSAKVDMWALGIILYQLVNSTNHPFGDLKNMYAVIDNIRYKEPAPLPSTVSPFIKEIIR
jgi:serine/threonine protein kinase